MSSMPSVYWTVRQASGSARSECDRLARRLQINFDEWAPYASMKSHIGMF